MNQNTVDLSTKGESYLNLLSNTSICNEIENMKKTQEWAPSFIPLNSEIDCSILEDLTDVVNRLEDLHAGVISKLLEKFKEGEFNYIVVSILTMVMMTKSNGSMLQQLKDTTTEINKQNSLNK